MIGRASVRIVQRITPNNIKYNAKLGSDFELIVSDGINDYFVSADIISEAKNSPIDKESINKVLSKVGNTPFKINNISGNISNNLFIRIKFRR